MSLKIIAISHPDIIYNEAILIPQLLDCGAEYFHLRKPNFTSVQIENFILSIPKQYHNRIVCHTYIPHIFEKYNVKFHITEQNKHLLNTNNLKFHSIAIHKKEELLSIQNKTSYALLSPIFDSISKQNTKSRFQLNNISTFITNNKINTPIYALGGIEASKINTLRNSAFSGIALLGYIWNTYHDKDTKEMITNFKKIAKLCQ